MRLLLLILTALSLTWSSTSSAHAKIGEPCARAEARVSGARAGADGTQGRRLYAQARYLEPNTGRFLSLDPVAGLLSEPLSTQGFSYAHANPTAFTDPSGRFVLEAAAASCIGNLGWQGCSASAYFSNVKSTLGFGVDMVTSTGDTAVKLGGAAGGFVASSYEDTAHAIEQGDVVGAIGAFSGASAVAGKVEERHAYLRGRGASHVEAAGIIVGDLSGFTLASEGLSGTSLEGDELTGTEAALRTVQGVTQIVGTVGGGLGLARSTAGGIVGRTTGPAVEANVARWTEGASKRRMISNESRAAGARKAQTLAADLVIVGDDTEAARLAGKIREKDGKFTVFMHGDEAGERLGLFKNDDWQELSHREVAHMIRNSGWEPGTPVRLAACNAGKGVCPVAQHLANDLGVVVEAPVDFLHVFEDGTMLVGPPGVLETGIGLPGHKAWKSFKPGANAR